ncbi:hypothetical protein SAMN02745136_05166 [Anaerocolumna jejuensis DSM 15929]|uniref:Site-specific recombinase XerD n=1 Tax=Anaerocolumna jejuensis DSM 15929 TaxID=1121322 RepID=A0A1M7BKN8_9FIRM|nr:hypothetical protein [Anaerocolumna jejuensis]SHL55497.1 hypothetical protein SAMN02745136_05166 [Anaerocolumna jejuensis DSM 15929]
MNELIESLKESFLLVNNDYRNDVENFVKYLDTQEQGASFYSKYTLAGMSTNGILDSLKYYVKIGQFKKKETARKYMSAIGQLFEYILANTDIENTDLKNQLGAPSNRVDSYVGQYSEYINNCDELLEKESNSILKPNEVELLLNWCNDEIDKNLFDVSDNNERIGFKRMVAAICIKLMLFVGITYRVARAITFNDLDIERGTIKINNFLIRLPMGLQRQLNIYKKLLKDRGYNVDTGFLFITIEGEQWGEKTSGSSIPTFLKTQLRQTSITSVIKYGVKQLVISGVSDNVIIKLTGISREILNDCLEPENDDTFSYINEKIIKTPIYKNL